MQFPERGFFLSLLQAMLFAEEKDGWERKIFDRMKTSLNWELYNIILQICRTFIDKQINSKIQFSTFIFPKTGY
jgi:hypothetical protein